MDTVAGIAQPVQPSDQKNHYDRDRYAWARRQVDALKHRDFEAVDWDNVTGEIKALVTGEESSLKSRYARIIFLP